MISRTVGVLVEMLAKDEPIPANKYRVHIDRCPVCQGHGSVFRGEDESLCPVVHDDPGHAYLSPGDTPYASGDRAYTGCFLCGRGRVEHKE